MSYATCNTKSYQALLDWRNMRHTQKNARRALYKSGALPRPSPVKKVKSDRAPQVNNIKGEVKARRRRNYAAKSRARRAAADRKTRREVEFLASLDSFPRGGALFPTPTVEGRSASTDSAPAKRSYVSFDRGVRVLERCEICAQFCARTGHSTVQCGQCPAQFNWVTLPVARLYVPKLVTAPEGLKVNVVASAIAQKIVIMFNYHRERGLSCAEAWSLSQKERNALTHALNGNIFGQDVKRTYYAARDGFTAAWKLTRFMMDGRISKRVPTWVANSLIASNIAEPYYEAVAPTVVVAPSSTGSFHTTGSSTRPHTPEDQPSLAARIVHVAGAMRHSERVQRRLARQRNQTWAQLRAHYENPEVTRRALTMHVFDQWVDLHVRPEVSQELPEHLEHFWTTARRAAQAVHRGDIELPENAQRLLAGKKSWLLYFLFATEVETYVQQNRGRLVDVRHVPGFSGLTFPAALITIFRRRDRALPFEAGAHLNARDSTQADIETNPGPATSWFVTGLLKAGSLVANKFWLPVSDNWRLKISLKHFSSRDSSIPDQLLITRKDREFKVLKGRVHNNIEAAVARTLMPCEFCAAEGRECSSMQPAYTGYTPPAMGDRPFETMLMLLGMSCRHSPVSKAAILAGFFGSQIPMTLWKNGLTSIKDKLPEMCTNKTHTPKAIRDYYRARPAVLGNVYGNRYLERPVSEGFERPRCPLCWPDNYAHMPEQSDSLAVPDRASRAVLMTMALDARNTNERLQNHSRLVIVVSGAYEYLPDFQWDGDTGLVILHSSAFDPMTPPVWQRVSFPAEYMPFAYLYAMLIAYSIPRPGGVIITSPGSYVSIPRSIFDHSPSTHVITNFTGDMFLGLYLSSTDQTWVVNHGFQIYLNNYRFGYGSMINFMAASQSRCTIMTPSANLSESAVIRSPCFTPPYLPSKVAVVRFSEDPDLVYATSSGPLGYNLAVAEIQNRFTPPPPTVESVWSLFLAENKPDHSGTFTVGSRDTVIIPRPRGRCVCLQCRLARRYGTLLWFATGTEGDKRPVRAVLKHLTTWGLDIIEIPLMGQETGQAILRALAQGRMMMVAREYIKLMPSTLRSFTTIGGPDLPWVDLTIGCAPPRRYIKSLNLRLGSVIAPVLEVMSGLWRPMMRVAAYPGVTHLPRSANGTDFLVQSTSTAKRSKRPLWAVGSAGYDVPPDAVVIQPGDHFSQMEKHEVVITHGGAGTVQTAALAGARVVAIDDTIDRNYLDPLNAGAGVVGGQDPNRILFLLLGVDWAPLVVSIRGGVRTFFECFAAYLSLYAAHDAITLWLLLGSIPWLSMIGPYNLSIAAMSSISSVAFGRATSFVISWLFYFWGDTIASRWGVSPANFIGVIFRAGRRVGSSFILGVTWATLGPFAGMVATGLYSMIPFTFMPGRTPTCHLVGMDTGVPYLPVHVELHNTVKGERIAGCAQRVVDSPLYSARRLPLLPEHEKEVRWSIPVFVDWDSLIEEPALGGYHLLTNNCAIVLLMAVNGDWRLFHAGGLALLAYGILSIVLGMIGGTIVSLTVITVFVMYVLNLGSPDSIDAIMAYISNKYSAVDMVEALAPQSTFAKIALQYAAALFTAPGFDLEESERAANIVTFRKEIAATYQAFGMSGLLRLLDRGNHPEGVEGELLSLSTLVYATFPLEKEKMFEAISTMDFEHTISAVDAVTTYETLMRQERALPAEFADVSLLMETGDMPPTTAIGQWLHYFANIQEENPAFQALDIFLPDIGEAIGAMPYLFQKYPRYGACKMTMDDLRVLDSYGRDSRRLVDFFFFEVEEVDFPYNPNELALEPAVFTEAENDTIAMLVAARRAVGYSEEESLALAIATMEPILHDGTPPAIMLDSAFNTGISEVYDKSRPFVYSLQWISWAFGCYRRWYHDNKSAYSWFSAPLDALGNFIGTFIATVSEGAARFITGLVSALVTMGVVPSKVWDHYVRLATMMAMILDPRHRSSPKPVWALLWKRTRAVITRGEQLIFSLAHSTYRPVASYEAWVDQMAALLRTDRVDVSFLSRTPPTREVFYPEKPIGVSEYAELPLAVKRHFTETADARRLMEESIRAGNGLAIDGAWMATPEVTQKSLERYSAPRPIVDHRSAFALSAAADAIFSRYRHLYDKPIPTSIDATAAQLKWRYAAGLPFHPYIKKRAQLRASPWFAAIKAAADRMLRMGIMPAVGFHAFPKAQVQDVAKVLNRPGALRTITAGDVVHLLALNTLMLERNKRPAEPADGLLNMMRRSEGSLLELKNLLAEHPNLFSGDGAQFDSTVVKEVATIGSRRLYERGIESFGLYNSDAAVSVVTAYYEALAKGLIVNFQTGDVIWKTGGGGTGSAATTPDNRDWTRLVFVAGWSLLTGEPPETFFDHFFFTNASDDVFFSCSDRAKALLPQFTATLERHFGVRFAFVEETTMNNILRTISVPHDKLEVELYHELQVPVPETGIAHDPQRMLFTRSAYRSDRVWLNPLVILGHTMERSCGYQLLCAHNRDMYTLVTTDLADATLEYALKYFRRAEIVVARSGEFIDDISLHIIDPSPSNNLKRYARKRHFIGNKTPEEYMAEQQKLARRFLHARKSKSYKEVFALWVRKPPPHADSKIAQRYRAYAANAKLLGPLADMMRLGATALSEFENALPKMLVQSLPEKVRTGIGAPFNTYDYTIEQFIWRHQVLALGRPPSLAEFSRAIRESPFAGVTDVGAFMALVAVTHNRDTLMTACLTNTTVRSSPLAVSNDAIAGRLLCFMTWYSLIDVVLHFISGFPIWGSLLVSCFTTYRFIETIYSILSILYWVGSGRASLAISNIIAPDRYVIQKRFAAILCAATPYFLTDYFVGLWPALKVLGPMAESFTWIPYLLNSARDKLIRRVSLVPDDSWDAFIAQMDTSRQWFIEGGTGTGKSTALPARLMAHLPNTRVIILVPYKRLVDQYVNDFVMKRDITLVTRDSPTAMTPATRLIVTTPGQYVLREHMRPANVPTVVIFDEAHVCTSMLWRAFEQTPAAYMKLVVTATPAGHLCESIRNWPKYTLPGRVRFENRALPAVATLEEAQIALRNERIPVREQGFYHPSVTTLDNWSGLATMASVPCRFATGDREPLNEQCPIFMSSVCLQGINIRPAPTAIAWANLKTVVGWNPDYVRMGASPGYVSISHDFFGNLFQLQSVPLSRIEAHQLRGRVGREKPGVTVMIGDPGFSEVVPDYQLLDLTYIQARGRLHITSRVIVPDDDLFLMCYAFVDGTSLADRNSGACLAMALAMGIPPYELQDIVSLAFLPARLVELRDELARNLDAFGFAVPIRTTLSDLIDCGMRALKLAAPIGHFAVLLNCELYAIVVASNDVTFTTRSARALTIPDIMPRPALIFNGSRAWTNAVHEAFTRTSERIGREKMLRARALAGAQGFDLIDLAVMRMSCCVDENNPAYYTIVLGENAEYYAVVWYDDGSLSYISKRHEADPPAALPFDVVCGRPTHLSWPDHYHVHSLPQKFGHTSFVIPANHLVRNLTSATTFNSRHEHWYRPRYNGPVVPWEPLY